MEVGDGGVLTMKMFFRMAPFLRTVKTGIFISCSFFSAMVGFWPILFFLGCERERERDRERDREIGV